MFKLFSILGLLILTEVLFSQTYSYESILKRADSIMIEKVGQRIFKNNYSRDSIVYYSYTDPKKRFRYEKLMKGGITKGKFIDLRIVYPFSLHFANNYTSTLTFLELDSLLNLHGNLNTTFIPQCIWEKDSCNFISKQTAFEIAKSNFKEKITIQFSPLFGYLVSANKYTWTVINDLGDDVSEDLIIDALTGKIIDYYKGIHVVVN